MWILPILVVGLAVVLSIPLGRYMARRAGPPRPAERGRAAARHRPAVVEAVRLAMLAFNALIFVFGYRGARVAAVAPGVPEPGRQGDARHRRTIFNTACSFLTNTNLQHYSGEVHLSYFSQLFVDLLEAVRHAGRRAGGAAGRHPRAARRRPPGQLLPRPVARGRLRRSCRSAWSSGVLLIAGGVPMTLDGNAKVTTLEGTEQVIARGPVAAIVAIKHLGTNGGGFFGAELGAPVREPDAVDQLAGVRRDHPHPDGVRRDVRADAQQPAARGGHLRRDARLSSSG